MYEESVWQGRKWAAWFEDLHWRFDARQMPLSPIFSLFSLSLPFLYWSLISGGLLQREESCICSLLVASYVFEKLVVFWYPLRLQAERV